MQVLKQKPDTKRPAIVAAATSLFAAKGIDATSMRHVADAAGVREAAIYRHYFGFNLPWWDRLLGTYLAQPQAGHERMTIGINLFRDQSELDLGRMLLQPFSAAACDYPINRRAG